MMMSIKQADREAYDPKPLLAARRRMGLSMQEIADRAGVSLPTVYSVMQARTAAPGTIAKVAEALKVDVNDCWKDGSDDADGPAT